MSLKDIDVESALRRIADRRIEEAMREGKFDNLSGAGKPPDLEAAPADEGARMLWWALRILKQNDVIPDEVQWRKRIDVLREQMRTASHRERLVELVKEINSVITQVNTLGTNAISLPVAPVSLEDELRHWAERGA
ncbi:MAG TPA: DUF1992 domain-containing protein [Tepidisphaeraceae bacterium]|jgi:hypothetical protein